MIAQLDAAHAAWARECLAAGDALDEVAGDVGLTGEQLLCALAIRRPMTEKMRAAASLYAAGTPVRLIDHEVWGARSTGAYTAGVLSTARRWGYAVPRRPPVGRAS